MADKEFENNDLTVFFDAAKDLPLTPPNALMARVLEDAIAAQPVAVSPRARPLLARRWREFTRAVGGWPAMAGLATATVAGVWLGVAPPAVLPDATNAYLDLGGSSYLVDAASDLGFDLVEEAL